MKKHDLTNLTLNEVDTLFGNGAITRAAAQKFVDKWNATPGRLMKAVLRVNYIATQLR